MNCPYCGCDGGCHDRQRSLHRSTWVTTKMRALKTYHPHWMPEGVLYVAESLYYDAYGQTGDEVQSYEEPEPDEEGMDYYDEWRRKTHRDAS